MTLAAFYDSTGNLSAINEIETGRTIAILSNGTLHPDYDTEEAVTAIAQFPAFDPASVIVEQQSPDWLNFRLSMLSNSGYNRIAIAVHNINPLLQQRLETTIALPNPHTPTVQTLWHQMTLIYAPTETELEQFRSLATQFHIPIEF